MKSHYCWRPQVTQLPRPTPATQQGIRSPVHWPLQRHQQDIESSNGSPEWERSMFSPARPAVLISLIATDHASERQYQCGLQPQRVAGWSARWAVATPRTGAVGGPDETRSRRMDAAIALSILPTISPGGLFACRRGWPPVGILLPYRLDAETCASGQPRGLGRRPRALRERRTFVAGQLRCPWRANGCRNQIKGPAGGGMDP